MTGKPTYEELEQRVRALERVESERKLVERSLQQGQEKYRRIYESSVVGFFQSTPEGRFLDVNPAFAKMLGYESPEALISSVSDIASQTYANPPDRSRYHKALLSHGYVEDFELKVRCKDGSEVWLSDSSRAFFDEDGNVVRYEGVVVDITKRKLAEEALRDSKDLLDATQRLAKVGGWVWNVESQSMTWTDQTYRIHGFDPDDVTPGSAEHIQRSLSCYDPDDQPVIESRLLRCAEEGIPYDLEFPFTAVDGRRKWIQTMAHPVWDGGRVVRVIGNIMDITDRRDAEDALREKEERLATTLDSIGDGVIATDEQGLVVNMNPLAEELCGWTLADAGGRSLAEVFNLVNTHTREAAEDPVRKVLETGRVVGLANHTMLLSRDGTEYQIADSAAPIRNREGRTTGVVLVFRDVTENYAAAERLRLSEERYDLAMEVKNEGMWDWNLVTNETYFDDRYFTMAGYEPNEFPQDFNGWAEHVHPDDLPGAQEAIRSYLSGDSDHFDIEFRFRRKDNSYIWLRGRGKVFERDEGGNPLRMIGTHTDITQRKQAETALQESEERFRLFAESAPVGIVISDQHEKTLYASPKFTEMFGYTMADMPSVNEWWQLAYPDEGLRRHARWKWKAAIDDTKNFGAEITPMDFPVSCKDGTVREIEFRMATTCNLNVIIFLDITERKNAEEALRKSEERYKTIVSSMNDLIFVLDEEDRFVDVHCRSLEMLLIPQEDFFGKTMADLLPPHVNELYRTSASNLRQSGEGFRYEYSLPIQGETKWFRSSLGLHTDGRKIVAVVEDITERKRAEETLRESEALLSDLFNSIQDGISLLDRNLNILKVNRVMEEWYTPNLPLAGKKCYECYQNIAKPCDPCPTLRSLQTGKTERDVVRGLPGSGVEWIELYAYPMRDADSGEIFGVVEFVRDITEHRRAEEALHDERRRLADILQGTNAGTWEWNVQTGETIFNARWAEIIGYTLDEISPLSIGTWRKFCHPDDFKASGWLLEKHFRGELDYYECEARMKHKDGGWMWVLDRGRLVSRTDDGKPLMMVGTHQDITDRKQAEERLTGAHNRLLTILNSIDATIYVADMNTHEILFMNNDMIKSFGGDFIGKRCFEVFRGEKRPCSDCTNSQLVDANGNPRGVVVWQGKNPITGKWYINYDRAMEWADGRLVRIEIATDITNLKEMEDQLRRAQKMEAIGTLAGGIAHNFNNVLMGIQGRASLMMMDKPPSNPDYEHLKGIKEYVRNATELTKDLLGFAREGRYEVAPVDLKVLIKHESRMFGRTNKEIRIHGKYEEPVWTVEVDPGQIRQVLLNLYINAWQAMPSGGDIYVQTKNVILDEDSVKTLEVAPGRYLRVSVTDTGIGMDDHTREKIFDPFFSTKGGKHGTGLGLASVYGIVKNHGGCINVYSEKGTGSTFNIYLPASEKQAVEQGPIPGREGIHCGRGTVLLVDDEDMIIEVGQQMLERLGYQVLIARSGEEALDVYGQQKEEIDLVILDMIMPGIGGGDVFEKLREVDPNARVLLSSGYSVNGQAKEIMDRGCNGFLQKPFAMEELSRKIKEVFAR